MAEQQQSSTPLLDMLTKACVDTFESTVNWVKEGGLTDAMENLSAKVSDIGHSISQTAQDIVTPSDKAVVADNSPVREKAISAPEVTSPISHDIATQVASAGINITSMQMTDVAEAACVSPHSTPAQAVASNRTMELG